MQMQNGSVQSAKPKLARRIFGAIGFGFAGLWLFGVVLNLAITGATFGAADLWSLFGAY